MFQERVLVSPDSLLALRSNASTNRLTVSFLIWLDISRSCDNCSNQVSMSPGAMWFRLTGCPEAGCSDPAYPVGPEAPWWEIDMSFSVNVEHDLEEGS